MALRESKQVERGAGCSYFPVVLNESYYHMVQGQNSMREGEGRFPPMLGTMLNALSLLVAALAMSSYSCETGTQIYCTWSEAS